MSHIDPGPLATYNSLLDKHLAHYFNNTRMKRHLKKSGLVTRRGHVVSESTFRLNMAQKEHKKHVRDLLAQAIVHKTLDMERHRQVDIRKKLEEIAKIELVRRVRADKAKKREHQILTFFNPRIPKRHYKKPEAQNSWTQAVANSDEEDDEDYKFGPLFAAVDEGARAERARKGDEEVLPYLSPRSQNKNGKGKQRPSSSKAASKGQMVAKGKGQQHGRPVSAPNSTEEQYDHPNYGTNVRQIWVDADGNPINPDELRPPYVDSDDENYREEKQRGNLSDFTDATNSRRSSFSSGSYRSDSPTPRKGDKGNNKSVRKPRPPSQPYDKNSPYLENQAGGAYTPPHRRMHSGQNSVDSTPRRFRPASQAHEPRIGSPGGQAFLHGSDSPGYQSQGTPASPPQYPQDEIDSRNLYSLDNTALREYTMQVEADGQGKVSPNPYTRSVFPPHVPSPPKGTPKRSPRGNKPSPKTQKAKPEPTDESAKKKNLGTLMLHRTEPAFKLQHQLQSFCEVTIHYHGSNVKIEHEVQNPYHEIVVEQQHCGGNTLAVFREGVLPDSEFTFISRRHRGYPFSLSFYINGVMDFRLSTCCEYKHTAGAKLGGKQGHFSVVSIEGGQMCYRCKLDAEARERERRRKEKRKEREQAKKDKVKTQMEKDRPERKIKPPHRKEDVMKKKEAKANEKTEDEREAELAAFSDSDTEEVGNNPPPEEQKEEPIIVPVQNSDESDAEEPTYIDDFEEENANGDDPAAAEDDKHSDNETSGKAVGEEPESEPETEVEVEGYEDDFEKDEKSETEDKPAAKQETSAPPKEEVSESDVPMSDRSDRPRDDDIQSDAPESARSDRSDHSVKSDKSDATTIVSNGEVGNKIKPVEEKEERKEVKEQGGATEASEVEETDVEDEYKKSRRELVSGTDTETADEVKSEVEKSESSSSEDEEVKGETTTEVEETDNELKGKSDVSESEAEDGKLHIDKSDKDLMKSEVEEICNLLRTENSVQSINLRNCSLDDDDLESLAAALAASPSRPKMLNLSSNYISSLGANSVVDILNKKPDLQILMLHGALRDSGVSKVAQGIINYQRQVLFDKTAKNMAKGAIKDAARSDSLQSIVSYNSTSTMQSDGGKMLALTQLDVGDCNMGPSAAKKVAEVIECTKLSTLNLSANKGLGSEGWEAIGKALKENGTIRRLCLEFCDIGDENMGILSEYLGENSSIESIDLESNGLTDEGAQKVLDAAIGNPSLKEIKMMPGNHFDNEILNDLNEILSMRRDDP